MSGEGAILDVPPFPISTEPNRQASPSVASNDAGFLVWRGSGGVLGARVTQSGQVLDPDPLVISPEDAVDAPTVASNGWTTWSCGNAIGPSPRAA